jgi:hypothetical protein
MARAGAEILAIAALQAGQQRLICLWTPSSRSKQRKIVYRGGLQSAKRRSRRRAGEASMLFVVIGKAEVTGLQLAETIKRRWPLLSVILA